MRNFSLVCLLLVGAVLSEANAQHRRYVNDRDSENQIDSTGTAVEEPERHHHHHRHHRHHHGRNHGGFHHRSGANLSQAEETIEFHRFFMRSVRSLAEQSGLCNDDVNTLLNIMEENRPPFKKEDRSQWTEEQWQVSKEEREQRKQLVRKQAYEQIQDQVHLTIFFDKLEAQKKLMKENIHKYIVARLTRIAVRSGLNDSQIEKFIRELESHKPVGVHWRPGMSQNEKKKNIEIHVKNWQQIKEACLRDASEAEQMQLNRFFAAVEKDFARSMHGDYHGEPHHDRRHHRHHHHHHHHHRRHHDEEDFPRESVRGHRRHYDDETENIDSEVRRPHRRHHHHHDVDEDFEERPRRHYHHHHRHHHETEEDDQAPLRRRSDEVDDSEEPRHHRRHHHHHHRRPHHVANSEDSEERVEDAPEHHHGRHHHHHRRQHRHQEEDSDNSEERKDEDFAPRRHHRRHQNRRADSEDIDDAKVRPEPYRHYRRHVRRQDSAEE